MDVEAETRVLKMGLRKVFALVVLLCCGVDGTIKPCLGSLPRACVPMPLFCRSGHCAAQRDGGS